MQPFVPDLKRKICIDSSTGKGVFDLSSSRLTSFALIFENAVLPQDVNILNLSSNRLTVFESPELTALESLDLSNNELETLPSGIYRHTNLQTLNLSRNNLDKLPYKIYKFTALKALYLFQNKLNRLPPRIHQLAALQVLNLNYNNLDRLSAEICNLTALISLQLNHNKLDRLPFEICNLTALTDLSVENNQLERLNPEIGRLTALFSLKLNHNKLSRLPPEIGRLIRLDILEIENNQLERLPPEIGELTELTEMRLEENKLIALPSQIGRLTKLSELSLDKNRLLTNLPLEIEDLSPECSISLENCGLSREAMQGILARVNARRQPGPRFIFSMRGLEQEIKQQSARNIIKALYKEIEKEPNQLSGIFEGLDRNSLHSLTSWLNRLSYMQDYKCSVETKKRLMHEIVRYLELADTNETFRGEFFTIIDEAARTCGDRMALSLIYLGIAYQSTTIEEIKPLAEFLKRGVWAIRLLEACAKAKIETLACCDPIEVYLAYPVKLKERLNLPIPVEDMLHFTVSAVTETDLDDAYGFVDKEINNETNFCEFLIEETRWKVALKKEFPEEYLALVTKKENDLEEIENGHVEANYEEIDSEFKQEIINLTKRALQIPLDNEPNFSTVVSIEHILK